VSSPRKIDLARMRKMIDQGRTTAQIAAAFDVQSPAVTKACHAHGFPLPHGRAGRKSPERPEPSRADDERELAILRSVASGEGIKRTAARFGIGGMTVQKCLAAIEAADLAESGEPVMDVARHYPRHKRGGFR
jgi:hypothetical protein